MTSLSRFCALLLFGLPVSALAQTSLPAGATVAYVSAQRVSNESAEGKAGQARVLALQRRNADDLRAMQAAIIQLRTRIEQATTEAERTELRAEEQQQQTELARAAAAAQSELQSLQREISAEIRPRVQRVLEAMLLGTSVQMVISTENSVVWAAPGLDLTDAVIERLDATAKDADQ